MSSCRCGVIFLGAATADPGWRHGFDVPPRKRHFQPRQELEIKIQMDSVFQLIGRSPFLYAPQSVPSLCLGREWLICLAAQDVHSLLFFLFFWSFSLFGGASAETPLLFMLIVRRGVQAPRQPLGNGRAIKREQTWGFSDWHYVAGERREGGQAA